MNNNFESLIDEFKKINKLGYVKGISNILNNSCGLTFEKLLDKTADSMYFPDYKDIEIKCTQRFSRYPIGLFSLSFDGSNLFESNYLLEKYGKQDSEFKNKKVLFVNLKYKEKVLVNEKYFFELDIDEQRKMIFINVYNLNKELLEKRAFINFKSIINRINVKLRNLALIYGSKRKINNELYFRYYKIICYKYKGFDYFIKALKNNYIKTDVSLRFARSGESAGKNKNKNMVFKIDKNNVDKVFEKIYLYEN